MEPFRWCKNLVQERDASKQLLFLFKASTWCLNGHFIKINEFVNFPSHRGKCWEEKSIFNLWGNGGGNAFNDRWQQLSSGTPGLQSPARFLLLLCLFLFLFLNSKKKKLQRQFCLRKGKDSKRKGFILKHPQDPVESSQALEKKISFHRHK